MSKRPYRELGRPSAYGLSPHVTTLDQVMITRDGETAIIAYRDTDVQTTHLRIGPDLDQMTDAQVLEAHNHVLRIQSMMALDSEYVPKEVPVGRPQLCYHESSDHWTPRGDVLRCLVSDGGPNGEATVIIDGRELDMEDIGELLGAYAGWGMRITFVAEDKINENPEVVVEDPEDGE